MYMEQGSAMVPDGTARRDVEAGATMCVLRTGSARRSGAGVRAVQERVQERDQERDRSSA